MYRKKLADQQKELFSVVVIFSDGSSSMNRSLYYLMVESLAGLL